MAVTGLQLIHTTAV